MIKNVCLRFCFILALVITANSGVALAEQSNWVEKKPARYRMVVADVNGQSYAALQIDMKPGWHTYWRFPGASGIAPEFNLAPQAGVKVGEPIFPAPYFFDDGIGGFYGYEGMAGFAFPLEVTDKTNLQFTGLIGVCREVCVPLDLDISLPVGDAPRNMHAAFIEGLLAQRPQMPSDDLRIETVSFDGVSLQLVITGKQLTKPQIMYIPGAHDVLGEPRIAARHPASYLVEIPAWSKLDHPLIGRKLTLVVRDGSRVVEQEIVVRDHRKLQ